MSQLKTFRLSYKTGQLMLCKEIVAVCSETHKNHRNNCTLCGQKFEVLCAFAELRKGLLALSCKSVRQHQTTRLPRGEIFMKVDF
jgi:hypothetical protein